MTNQATNHHDSDNNKTKHNNKTNLSRTEMRDLAMERFEQQQQQQQQGDNNNDNRLYWESLWQDGLTAWDLGRPTPALLSELEQQQQKQHHQKQQQHEQPRKDYRMLVPGCGAGYDVGALVQWWLSQQEQEQQQHDDDDDDDNLKDKNKNHHSLPTSLVVMGLDISPLSLQHAATNIQSMIQQQQQEKQKEEKKQHQPNTNKTNITTNKTTSTRQARIELVLGDFFQPTSTWKIQHSFVIIMKEEGGGQEGYTITTTTTTKPQDDKEENNKPKNENNDKDKQGLCFDFIFDYTFFCALLPSLRHNWGQRMSQLIRPQQQQPSPPPPNDDDDHDCNKDSICSSSFWSGGQLLTLMFPIFPTTTSPSSSSSFAPPTFSSDVTTTTTTQQQEQFKGPPFPVTVLDYQNSLEPHGWRTNNGSPHVTVDTIPSRKGMELACWWTFQQPTTTTKTKLEDKGKLKN